MLAGNAAMLALLRTLGLPRRTESDGDTVTVLVDLAGSSSRPSAGSGRDGTSAAAGSERATGLRTRSARREPLPARRGPAATLVAVRRDGGAAMTQQHAR